MSSMRGSVVLAAAVLFGIGCAAKEEPAEGTPEAGAKKEAAAALALPEGARRIGEEITVGEPVRLATVRRNPSAYFDRTILVEARAEAVCQNRGCWLTISDGDGKPIWVRWSTGCGGRYAFPKDAAGKRVLVQGSFYEKEVSPEDAKHLAGENAKLDAGEIAGKTYEMNATAFVVLPAGPSAPEEAAS